MQELQACGLAAEAEALARAASVETVREASLATSRAAEAAGAKTAVRVTVVTATSVTHAMADITSPDYVSWAAFAGFGAALAAGFREPAEGNAAERNVQAEWLADRLGLARD